MVNVGLLVRLEAKPGKEAEVEQFLEGGLALVQQEPGTTPPQIDKVDVIAAKLS